MYTLPLRRNDHQRRRNVLDVPLRTLKRIFRYIPWSGSMTELRAAFRDFVMQTFQWVVSIALLENGAMLHKPLGCFTSRWDV